MGGYIGSVDGGRRETWMGRRLGGMENIPRILEFAFGSHAMKVLLLEPWK